MSDYMGTTKSNKFKVKNKEKAELIINSMCTDGDIYFDITETDNKEEFLCWFGSTGSIVGIAKNYNITKDNDEYTEDDEANYDFMLSELQSIVAENSYINLIEVGYEKLRYVNGHCVVITKDKIKHVNLIDYGDTLGEQMLEK